MSYTFLFEYIHVDKKKMNVIALMNIFLGSNFCFIDTGTFI